MSGIRPGPGGGAGGASSVAAGDITDVGATGEALVQAETAAEANATLASRVVDALAGSGWTSTVVGGAAAATWETGPARLLLTNPAAALGDEAYAANATFIPEADAYDLYVRADFLTSTSAGTWISLRAGRALTDGMHFDIRANGAMDIYRNVGGSVGSAIATVSAGATNAPSTSQLASGDFWARIARRPTGVAFSWGVGAAGALPDAWTTVHVATDAPSLNASNGRRAHLNTYAANSVVGGFNVDVLDIRATGAGLGPL